jgi:hypothetical protein
VAANYHPSADAGPQPDDPYGLIGLVVSVGGVCAHGEDRVGSDGGPDRVQIDHVLVGDSLTSLGTHTISIDGTDHLAVVAELAIN